MSIHWRRKMVFWWSCIAMVSNGNDEGWCLGQKMLFERRKIRMNRATFSDMVLMYHEICGISFLNWFSSSNNLPFDKRGGLPAAA